MGDDSIWQTVAVRRSEKTADGVHIPDWDDIEGYSVHKKFRDEQGRRCTIVLTHALDQDLARLIAAAPDLLEALELILPLAKGYVAKNQVGSNQQYVESAEAAIAKARS